MAQLVTGPELRTAVEQELFIKGGVPDNAEDVKYDFRLSNNILKALFGRPVDASKLSVSETTNLVVDPGEVVFVLSEERLALPPNMIAQLSPKRKMSQAGVLTLGGLTIDPGYQGPLLVGLFNFSSTPFVLQPGRKLIAATFYRLSEEECKNLRGVPDRLESFPEELINVMEKYRPIGSKSIMENLDRIEGEITRIKQDLRDRDEWKERLDRHDSQIEGLIRGLEEEKRVRVGGEDRFTQAIDKLNRTFLIMRGGALVLYAILALVLIPFLVQWLPKLIKAFS